MHLSKFKLIASTSELATTGDAGPEALNMMIPVKKEYFVNFTDFKSAASVDHNKENNILRICECCEPSAIVATDKTQQKRNK